MSKRDREREEGKERGDIERGRWTVKLPDRNKEVGEKS